QRIDDGAVARRRHGAGDLLHEAIDVLELLQCGPSGVAALPVAARFEPDGEGFGEVLVGMALRVPAAQVLHVPLARRVRAVGFRILRARAAEEPLPLTAAMQLVAVLDGVAALVAHDLHALVVRPALNLDELALLEPHEAGMQEIEGHGEAAHAAGREPLVAHPDVRLEADAARVELSVQLVDAVADPGTVEGDAEVPQLDLQEALVGPTGPG